jgi:hypothetical protein
VLTSPWLPKMYHFLAVHLINCLIWFTHFFYLYSDYLLLLTLSYSPLSSTSNTVIWPCFLLIVLANHAWISIRPSSVRCDISLNKKNIDQILACMAHISLCFLVCWPPSPLDLLPYIAVWSGQVPQPESVGRAVTAANFAMESGPLLSWAGAL